MPKQKGSPIKQINIVKTMLENPNGELSIAKLAKEAGCTRGRVYDLIDRLEEEKLVSRTKVTNPEKLISLLRKWQNERDFITYDISKLTNEVQQRKRRELARLVELPRGMRDFESNELAKIKLIREKFQETAQLFGFKQMAPSPIELFSTLEAKSGPAIRKEIYEFDDKGKRNVALRFDFTVGLTRYVAAQKSLRLPAKFSTFGGVWRYDEPQKGRYRFFNQWNIEIYGKPNVETNAEVIEFTARLFDNLKLRNIIVDINDRNLVQSYIEKIFDSNDEKLVGDIFRAVDKIQKKSKEEILAEYKKEGYEEDKLEKILEFSKIKGTPDEIESIFDVSGLESWDKLKQLWDSLKNRGVNNIRINFGIVRGLDYYSGMVFEVFDKTSDLGALAGGGNYDALTKAFGREDIGATGVAGGVERIIMRMEDQGVIEIPSTPRISVAYATEEMLKPAMNLASKLRQSFIPVDVDLLGKNLKKQMAMASDSKFTIIAAPKEYSSKAVVLRNMSDGKEKQVPLKSILSNPRLYLKL